MSPVSSQAKTLWIINHFATHPSAPGGTRHYDFGVELAKRGYKVTIFASDFNYMLRKRMREACRRLVDLNHVRFVWVRSLRYNKNNWRRAANMLSFAFNVIAIGAVRKRPDVIIGSSPHLFAALSAYILAKIKSSRFYLEIRDLWPQALIDMKEQRAKSRELRAKSLELRARSIGEGVLRSMLYALCSTLYAIAIMLLRKIENLLYRKADRIIVLSEGAGKYIAGCGIDPKKISLLPNGVYLEEFKVSEDRASVRERLGLIDEFVVMYAGAHGPANALSTIVRSAEILRRRGDFATERQGDKATRPRAASPSPRRSNVVFMLVGDGPCKSELQRIVNEKGLSNVELLPAVPKSLIPNLLNAADALVITLRSVVLFSYGVSPNKLFEYMASGKPILCAVNGEVAGLVTRANAGVVVEPENPESLVQAILSMIEDSDRCSIYGANGRKFVEENFSRSRIVENLVSILDSRC